MTPQTLERDFVDLEQCAIAAADRKFADVHGDQADWSPQEQDSYVGLIARVHAVFHPVAAPDSALLVLMAAFAASHSPSDRIAYRLDAELLAHPELCSTAADYPDWTPDGAVAT